MLTNKIWLTLEAESVDVRAIKKNKITVELFRASPKQIIQELKNELQHNEIKAIISDLQKFVGER